MRRFSPEFIEQVRLANNIVDIIGEDTFLKRSGAGDRYTGLCPFPSHNEKTPSFSVSESQQLYHCFGCNESGNIFTYFKARKAMPFNLAVEELARRAGIALPADKKDFFTAGKKSRSLAEDQKTYQRRQKLLAINQLACEFYEQQLKAKPLAHKVKKYLNQREFSPETIQHFRLGYAEESWSALLDFLQKKGVDLSLAVHLGIIRKKESRHYDQFRDRLMFPIFAKNGKEILGFGGRSLEENSSAPKYINSMDSEVFHKGKTFYGWHSAPVFIRNAGKVLVVEGYTDYLSLYQNGVKNVTATLGTALTEDHVRWLSWHTRQAVVFFDGDSAGEKAALRSLSVLLFFGLIPRLLKLEEGMDPDSFIRQCGADALQKKIDEAPDLFMYVFSNELKKYSAGADRFSLIEKMAGLLAHTKNEMLRKYYSERIVDSFGFDERLARRALDKALNKEMNRRSGSRSVLSFSSAEVKPVSSDKDLENQEISLLDCPKTELYLLILALQDKQHCQQIAKPVLLEKFSHSGVKELFKLITNRQNGSSDLGFEMLSEEAASRLAEPGFLQRENYLVLTRLAKEDEKVFIQDCIHKIEKASYQRQIKQATADMRLDLANSQKYLIKIKELTKVSKQAEMKYDK